jgi:O-antigen/teichoic acid export membrane protein
LIAKIFLGIYYNLSVWYKLTNRNLTGAWITLGGVVITIVLNFLLVPSFGYIGCAIATLCCYGAMMISSYLLGQKYYPVPYDLFKIFMYIFSAVILYIIHRQVISFTPNLIYRAISGIIFGISFMIFVLMNEKKELKQLPVIGKFLR